MYVLAASSTTEIIEDVPGTAETAESAQCVGAPPPPSAVAAPSQEKEPYKKLGLTKQVLAAHTQKEEQAFLFRFRELRGLNSLKANCSQYLERQREQVTSDGTSDPPASHITSKELERSRPSKVVRREGIKDGT